MTEESLTAEQAVLGEDDPIEVGDVHELLQLLDLSGITHHEIRGRLLDEPGPSDGPTSYNIEVQHRDPPAALQIRFQMTVHHPAAEYVIDISSLYSAHGPFTVSREVVAVFIEKVAVMAVFPFLREGLATTAARMELPVPIIGLLRPGMFKVDVA